MRNSYKGGWIEVICGSMFSGKTEELIRRVRRARIARQKVQVFKPALDRRYHAEHVSSHNGVRWDAVPVSSAREILERLEPETSVVAVDEVQFFDWELSKVCNELADRGLLLMAEAEEVTKLQAICVVCGAPASRTQRLIDGKPAAYDDPIILVGGSESYEARCRYCHEVPLLPRGAWAAHTRGSRKPSVTPIKRSRAPGARRSS